MKNSGELHKITIDQIGIRKNYIKIVAVVIITVLVCTLPMGLSPFWNGEIPEHRNQYEIMAYSLKNGHIYMDYGWG